MAARTVPGCLLVAVFLAVLAVSLEPCSGLPLDTREQRLTMMMNKFAGGENDNEIVCHLCEAAVSIIKEYLEENGSVHDAYPLLEPLCIILLNKTLDFYGPYMCPGIVYSYGPVLFYVLAESQLQPKEFCTAIQLCNDTHGTKSSLPHLLPSLLGQSRQRSWADQEMRPSSTAGERFMVQGRPPHFGERGRDVGRKGDETVFLHLSDIHLDLLYTEGSPSLCNLYLCCRSWYNGTGPAGHYGNYECDLPLVTLDVVVEAISQLDPRPDFIIYTGDNSPHDSWNETWASQFEATNYLISYLTKKLPDIYIYPALGNHESFPESEYMGTLPQYQELTRKMAEYWEALVPLPQSALDTIADGAYYSLLVRDKLRVLSFNSDYGYIPNFYTLLNKQNPLVAKQESWIIDTLEQAEKAGEKVLIIAHVPPGDRGDTLHEYDEFYFNLTKRFRDTIVGHLFGHTHHDEFKLIQDEDGVYGTVLVCPSVTPRGRSNPSFRVFSMDPSSYQLLSYQQFHLNLTLANELAGRGVQPKMELGYSTSDLYHLPDLTPSSWAGLVERFSQYPDLVSDYLYNKYGQSSSHDKSCDPQCVHETICTVSNVINSERKKCTGD